MTDELLNHATFREQIAAALAGGLTAAEQAAFEAHAASCPSCAAELVAAREVEQRMMATFAGARPVAGFEDRVVQRLRTGATARWRRPDWLDRPNWVHPAVRRAVTGVAAAVLLGGFGYVATRVIERERGATASHAAGLAQVHDWDYLEPTTAPQLLDRSRGRGGEQSAEQGRASTYGLGLADLADQSGKDSTTRLGRENGRWDRASGTSNRFYRFGSDAMARQPGSPRDSAARKGGAAAITLDTDADGAVPTDAKAIADATAGGLRGAEAENLATFNLQNQPNPTSGQGGGGQSGRTRLGGSAGGAVVNEGKTVDTYYDTLGGTDGSKPVTGWFKPAQLGERPFGDRQVAELGMPVQIEQEFAGVAITAGREDLRRTPAQQAAPVTAAKSVTGELLALQTAPVAPQSPAQPAPPPADGPAPAPAPVKTPVAPAADPTPQPTSRKIIRNGTVEFEVDRFDSAFAQVVKLVQEAGGYVGTTDSEKLPNGKVKGTITVRIPPDRLDTLVLQLRGIGDLKSQKLEAQDVSKKYSDLDSELRAARAMEERLLAIIKEGKGQIKDLLAAEKELGVWRTKIEQITGELRYFDNLVAMSTLNITLFERDIRTPATAIETETIDAGVESEDVEKARGEALKAIEEAKGRVIQSDLKRYDAGQFGATIVAEVPPDRAGPLMDRIKQIGKVARLDVQRKQSTPESQPHRRSGDGATQPPVKVERRDTRLNLSLYNLANVAPRQTTVATLAADDVEQAYRAILDRVTKAGGRIVTSNVARSKPEQTTGTISFEAPAAQADAVLNDVRALGDVMKLAVTENPDVQNVTTAKRGFNVALVSTASVAPRETLTMQLAVADVAAARDKILQAAGAAGAAGGGSGGGPGGARVLSSSLNETDKQNATARLDLDVKRSALPAIEKALTSAGQTVSRQSSRSTDTENTLDSKLRLTLTVVPADQLPPRETTTMAVELRDVEAALGDFQATAASVGGRVVESNLSKDRDGRSQAKVAVEVPLDKAGEVVKRAEDLGVVRAIDADKNLQVPSGPLSRARIDVTFGNADAIVAPESGLWASIRRGLSTSVAGLAWSVQLIVIGLCFVLPWALILWAGWKWMKRRTRVAATTTPTPAA